CGRIALYRRRVFIIHRTNSSPKATSSEPPGLSDNALKALIASEHKSLGLSARLIVQPEEKTVE
ncbi:hypothetical protein, partial [Salmonella enterica]|uniref:hypothetical protein n=1 Tax=Salmonella enterica TaxID=28901 RepID=UPI0021B46E5F